MDKKIKIVAGIVGVAIVFEVQRLSGLIKKHNHLVEVVKTLVELEDIEFQASVDERFKDIVDGY